LQLTKAREDYKNEVSQLNLDLEDENTRTSTMDHQLTELRREVIINNNNKTLLFRTIFPQSGLKALR
jgi:predicted  nucleic acid-binding Zn-ribbon protein